MISLANLTGNIQAILAQPKGKGVVAPVVFIASGILTELLTLRSRPLRKILEGQPLVVIKNGKIIRKNMANTRYDLAELLMALRKKDIFDLGEVEFAVLEPNGKVSVQKKSQYRPVTPKDFKLSTGYEGLSSVLISDGKVLEKKHGNERAHS